LVHRDDVHELVIHERLHPFGHDHRFERETHRRDLKPQRVERQRRSAGVAVVREIREQNGDLVVGTVLEEAGQEAAGVAERDGRVGREIVLGG
jgi:hypothetical protein